MARKSPNPKSPPPAERTRNVLSLRGSSEWMAWLGRLRAHVLGGSQSATQLIDLGLSAVARDYGFAEPAPPRVPPRTRLPASRKKNPKKSSEGA